MEGRYSSWEAYLKAMQTSKVWVDTPFLYAASAVFEMQFHILLSNTEPQLLVASHVAGYTDLSVGLVANLGNVHFYALEPDTTTLPLQDEAGTLPFGSEDLLLASLEKPAIEPEEVSMEPEEVSVNKPMSIELRDQDRNLLDLCGHLMVWRPFEMLSTNLPEVLRAIQPSFGDISTNIMTVLSFREFVKFLQWEAVDHTDSMSRDYEYSVGKKHHCNWFRRGAGKVFKKSQRLANKLDPEILQRQLDKPCWNHGTRHTCLDVFRKHPNVALRWRTLWYSLPKADRDSRLRDMFATGVDREDALMQYRVLGLPVCRNAFMTITGMTTDVLQAARKVVYCMFMIMS